MSTIDKMSIQGIRSFGPEEKKVIQFFNPLTLILGPNGTGKTTIIECLKYISTGLLPPGASKGGAFIHDPKIAHEREVKGQVKLKFRDISQQMLVVERSLTATQKAKKVEMKTLEGVITRFNAEGDKTSINSKCADLDRMMISSLGVARPVLENVIFCHQEDANWPLSEGKQLKEKFDAIFASTRYVKALDNIKKIKKSQLFSDGLIRISEKFNGSVQPSMIEHRQRITLPMGYCQPDDKLKLYRQDIQYLKQYKDKAHQIQCELTEQEGKLEASKESVEKIKTELKPIEDKINKIHQQYDEIVGIQNEKTKLTSEKKQIGKSIDELHEQIENEFQGTDEELKRMLAEFQDKLEERQRTLQEYESRQKELARSVERLDKEKSAILVEVGRLEQEAERHAGNISKRDDSIRRLAREFQFEGLAGSISDDKYKLFLQNVKDKLATMMDDTRQLKEGYEEKEKAVQTKMDGVRETRTKLEQSQQMKKKMMTDNEGKIREIKNKLSEIEASGGRLDQLKRELKRNEHDLTTLESSVNTDELKQEIESLKKQKTKLDAQISELSSEMNRLTLQSSAQAQLDVLKKDRTTKEDNISRLKAKLEDTIKHILGHVPSRNVRVQLEEYISQQSQDVRKCTADLNKAKNNMSKLEMERKMKMEQLKQKESELKDLEERVYNACGSQNFDEGLSTINDKLDKARDQRGSLLGARHFFQKYVEGLEKDSPCCPLCHRSFDQQQEARELIFELRGQIQKVPSKLERAEKDVDEYQEKYDELMQLKPLREKMDSLQENDIPTLKASLKKNQEGIQKLRDEINELEGDLQIRESDETVAKDMRPDVIMMDKYYSDVAELDKKISTQAAKLTGGDTGRTLQMVIDEKEDLQMKVDSIAKKLDYDRQKLSDFSDQLAALRTVVNSLREEKLTIENDLQQRIKLEEDKAELTSENEGHSRDIKEAGRKLVPLQEQIEQLKEDKDRIVEEKETKIEEAKAEVESVKRSGMEVRNINQEIKSYNQSGKADDLDEKKSKKEKVETKLEKIETETKEVVETIDKLRKALATQKVREMDLQNNVNLRSKKRSVEKMRTRIADLDEQLAGLDVAHLNRDKQELQVKQEKLTRERHTAEGRQRGFEDTISGMRKELRSDMYKDAEGKYRNKMIELRTTELANKDLEKYYYALDKAIMNYHNIKMEEINKIIRELWRNTYRGHDIETIEIRSDQDDTASMSTRKTYNYRVVMIKPGDAVIDMRGRCSAGQKVLASLIIRLALAETFCLNCGILALDEPTTNLDRENIESLAGALVEIIKSRAHQRNFQLVVITHDEDFVELLGRSEYVEEFFKVSKDQYGCSQLAKANVADLHSR